MIMIRGTAFKGELGKYMHIVRSNQFAEMMDSRVIFLIDF